MTAYSSYDGIPAVANKRMSSLPSRGLLHSFGIDLLTDIASFATPLHNLIDSKNSFEQNGSILTG